ncbi:hypothetical protein F2Q69_00058708 [Brassica cretica]|uniref:Uncharacterized protein n=1 Tax=Brassica cretica TaxID=69181 RepID=A0A8S9RLW1_BRACR|nr:hypothetical protein F2Q69_00058708 [Brassica cretica]
MDLSISALTSKIEAIQGELVEIQSYIPRRSEASASVDRRNNKSTDIHHRTSVDEASNLGRLVQKVTSDMPDTHNHGEEISADTYARLMRHQFILESLGDILQNIEDATTIMKDKWRRRDEAMRDFTVVKEEKLQEGDFEVESLMSFGGSHWCRSTPTHKHRSTEVTQNQSISSPGNRSTTPTESTASCNAVRIMTHEEFAAKHPHPPSHVYVKIDRHSDPVIDRHQEPVIDRHQETVIYRQQRAPIDRRAPITYRVLMPKIDDARVNALWPKPKPSENPPETVRTPSDDGVDPMQVDRIPTGRTLRKRKEKVAKHLKRGANEKEKESFQKRVFRIPLDKSFHEAYFTHRFFRETRETEEDIRRMFSKAREKMRMRITLKKKSNLGKFAIPCTVKGIVTLHRGIVRDLEVQIGNALVPVDFHVLDIKLNWNSSLLLGRAFLSTVGAVCNLQTNQLCPTLIDPHVHYNPIPVKKPQTTPRRINVPGIIAACHCGVEYETEYSASIETHTATLIDSAHQILTDTPKEKSVDSSPDEWENDYYNPIMATHNMHTEEYDEDYEE